MANLILEENLGVIKWYDISIQTLPNGKNVLILICEGKENSDKLIQLISQNPYNLIVSIEANGNYALSFEFFESEHVLKLLTQKSEKNYPPVKKLHDNKITFLTTGVWTGDSPQGRNCEYHSQLVRLGELNIGEALSQANEVHFISGENKNTPSTVVLVYENWDHISNAEAMDAFNELVHLTKGNPTMEIRQTGDTLNLKIWDILINLDINITGLKYLGNQLIEFLKKTSPKDYFCLVIGFPPPKNAKVALAFRREDGQQVIMLKGYVYKTSN